MTFDLALRAGHTTVFGRTFGARARPCLAATALCVVRRDARRNRHRVMDRSAATGRMASAKLAARNNDAHGRASCVPLSSKTKKWSLGCEVVEISKLLAGADRGCVANPSWPQAVAARQSDHRVDCGRASSSATRAFADTIARQPAPAHALQKRHCESERRHLADEAFGRGRKHVENDFASVPARARHQLPRLAPARAGRVCTSPSHPGRAGQGRRVPAGIYAQRVFRAVEAQRTSTHSALKSDQYAPAPSLG